MADDDGDPRNNDELIAKMQKDERTYVLDIEFDKDGMGLHGLELMSPRDYSKVRGTSPQSIYYYIRTGVIEPLECLCGRHVIDAFQADQALEARQKARGQRLDTSGVDSEQE